MQRGSRSDSQVGVCVGGGGGVMSLKKKKVCSADIDRKKVCFHISKKKLQVDRQKKLLARFCQKTQQL